MRHHLVRTARPDVAPAEFILEPGVAALGHGPLLVTHGVRRFELLLFPAARVVVDQRYMAQTGAVLVQFLAAVRRVGSVFLSGFSRASIAVPSRLM